MSGTSSVGAADTHTRLEYGTFSDEKPAGPHAIVKVFDYGDGYAEVTWSKQYEAWPRRRKREGEDDADRRPPRLREEMNAADRERSDRRARANFGRRVMASRADRLLTLTYRENITDLDSAVSDLDKFVRKMRETHGEFAYVAVAETQKRGAIHFHLAIAGFHDITRIRHCWLYVVGDGNADITKPRKGSGPIWKRNVLARYMGKYLSKQFNKTATLGKHRYWFSRGIEIPMRRLYTCLGDTEARIFHLLRMVCGRPYSKVWRSEDFEAGWACSWP